MRRSRRVLPSDLVQPRRTNGEVACAIIYVALCYGAVGGITTFVAYALDPFRGNALNPNTAWFFTGRIFAIYSVAYMLSWLVYSFRPTGCRYKTIYVRAPTIKPFELTVIKSSESVNGALEDDWTIESSDISHAIFFCLYLWSFVVVSSVTHAWAATNETGIAVTIVFAILTVLLLMACGSWFCNGPNDGADELDSVRRAKARVRYAGELLKEHADFVRRHFHAQETSTDGANAFDEPANGDEMFYDDTIDEEGAQLLFRGGNVNRSGNTAEHTSEPGPEVGREAAAKARVASSDDAADDAAHATSASAKFGV